MASGDDQASASKRQNTSPSQGLKVEFDEERRANNGKAQTPTLKAKGDSKIDCDQNPCSRPYFRSYVSQNRNPLQWVEEPFKEGETVLFLQPVEGQEGPFVIKANHGGGRYNLHYIERIVYGTELKRPDYQLQKK